MIIAILGIIVFQLVERIAIIEKSMKSVLRKCSCVLGFSYNTIPTRHEVQRKPYLQEEYNIMTMNPQNYQTLRIWRKYLENELSAACWSRCHRFSESSSVG